MRNLRGLRRARRRGGCAVGCDISRTDDTRLPWSTGGDYGGWGGHAHHGTEPDGGIPVGVDRNPVVFVHGNQRDACDWESQATFFLQRGYTGDDLWAVTFREGTATHVSMAEQLDAFVGRVREHTGSDTVDVVAHSLGVTGARYWLDVRDRLDWVGTFVGLAGANHGTVLNSWCATVDMCAGPFRVSPFLRADYESREGHPLGRLNEEETPGEVDYFTLRGTEDPLFWGCEDSPALEGATNVAIPAGHDEVRTALRALENVYRWVADSNPYDLRNQVAVPG